MWNWRVNSQWLEGLVKQVSGDKLSMIGWRGRWHGVIMVLSEGEKYEVSKMVPEK
jgi:hypothetical protein